MRKILLLFVAAFCCVSMSAANKLSLYAYSSWSSPNYAPYFSVTNTRASAAEAFTGKIRYPLTNYNAEAVTQYVALGVKNSDNTYTIISDSKQVTIPAYSETNGLTISYTDTLSFSYAFPVGRTVVYGMVSDDGTTWEEAGDNNFVNYELVAYEQSLVGNWSFLTYSSEILEKLGTISVDYYGYVYDYPTVEKGKEYTIKFKAVNGAIVKTIPSHKVTLKESCSGVDTDIASYDVPELAPGDSAILEIKWSPINETVGSYVSPVIYDAQNISATGSYYYLSETATGINTIGSLQPSQSVSYYDISGRHIATPSKSGLYIKETTFEDGSKKEEKVLRR